MVHSQYNKTVLPNGLTIISEQIPSVRSVSVGFWIKSGSRNELKSHNGVAHFLEHMMFKGTKKRSAKTIARTLESVGGYLNAFTAKEYTCYYAEILDEHLAKAVNVLSDMLCNSSFIDKEINKEREVILDEIDSIEDTPDDLVQELFIEKLFPENSLGYPILGSKETIQQMDREEILNFYANHYTTNNVVVAAAGNLDHSKLVEICAKKVTLPAGNLPVNETVKTRAGKGEFIIDKMVNQAHICIGSSALPYAHKRKYELLLLNTLLGVGMSSRLFQNIRERHGVAYSIYSFLDFYRDNGLMAIYLGTEKNKTTTALKLLEKEVKLLKKKLISRRELNMVKSQLKGNLVLGLESTARRMSRLAKMEVYLQNFQDLDQVIEDIDKVTSEGILELIHQIFDTDKMLKVIFLPKN